MCHCRRVTIDVMNIIFMMSMWVTWPLVTVSRSANWGCYKKIPVIPNVLGHPLVTALLLYSSSLKRSCSRAPWYPLFTRPCSPDWSLVIVVFFCVFIMALRCRLSRQHTLSWNTRCIIRWLFLCSLCWISRCSSELRHCSQLFFQNGPIHVEYSRYVSTWLYYRKHEKGLSKPCRC